MHKANGGFSIISYSTGINTLIDYDIFIFHYVIDSSKTEFTFN